MEWPLDRVWAPRRAHAGGDVNPMMIQGRVPKQIPHTTSSYLMFWSEYTGSPPLPLFHLPSLTGAMVGASVGQIGQAAHVGLFVGVFVGVADVGASVGLFVGVAVLGESTGGDNVIVMTPLNHAWGCRQGDAPLMTL